MRIIDGRADGPPATIAQIAAIEFKAASGIAGMSPEQREKTLRGMMERVHKAATIAATIVARDKDALVRFVAAHHDSMGPWLMELALAGDAARSLADIIRGAEAHLAAALAVVEGDEPDDPPDDGRWW
jgi:hypothetical protein